MAIVTINDTNLVAIAEAIRGKNGESTTYKPSEMAQAITDIPSGGGGSAEITLTDMRYFDYEGTREDMIIELGSNVKTQDLTSMLNAFYRTGSAVSNTIENIDIVFNMKKAANLDCMAAFYGCSYLKEVPAFNWPSNVWGLKANSMFYNCKNIREIPDYIIGATGSLSNYASFCYGCQSLRKLPYLLTTVNCTLSSTYAYLMPYQYILYNCHSMDEANDIVMTEWTGNITSNLFSSSSFTNTYRLKDITFQTNDGTSYIIKAKSQTIDLTTNVGYGLSASFNRNLNNGIDDSKEVYDDATYQALKDDPDWFTENIAYSRYNHDSAVRTINSLPDTSAYLASAGGTNTIKFKGAAGELTDGGAINTLTEEEIAVATAKGWTVTIS